jgi:hypothetical protein
MSLESFSAALTARCGGYWMSAVPRLRETVVQLGLSAEDATAMLERAQEHARRSQRGRAANWLAAALVTDQDQTVRWLNREGLLRASKYRFDPTLPRFLANDIWAHADDLGLSAHARTFWTAHIGLLGFAGAAHEEFRGLLALLRQEPYTLLRSCLITLDILFLREMHPQLDFGLPWNLGTFTKEDLAEGFSLFWSLAHAEIGVSRKSAGLWDAPRIHSGRYLEVLKRTAALREFCQAEILVGGFDYRCATTGTSAVLAAPNPEVEKGIRFGYIDGQMRRARLVGEATEIGAARLVDLGVRLHAAMTEARRIRLVDEDTPLRRVRLEFPVFRQFTELLRSPEFAAEELPGMVEAIDAYGLTPANAAAYRVSGRLTVRDVLLAQRLAVITASCVAQELFRHRYEPIVFVNSASPVYREDEALDRFLEVVLEPGAARDFRELFRWPPVMENVAAGLDVQYRPLLEAEHEWHVPMFILASSDLVRAAFMLTGQRPGAERQLLENMIAEEFHKAGHPARAGIQLRSGAQTVAELDVAALVEDTLVILECKNSLLPCNLFELRTSRDQCEKAARQLDRALQVLRTGTHREHLLARLGAGDRPVNHVATGIVVGNRLFIGSRIDGHVVMSPWHLSNFIGRGEIQVVGHAARTRAPGGLTGQMIRDFCGGAFYAHVFGAMVPVTRQVVLGGRDLTYESYALDFIALGAEFGIAVDPEELRAGGRDNGYRDG